DDQAGALRAHLVAGAPCPVCTQPVATVPATPTASAVAQAKADGEAARAQVNRARDQVTQRDAAARELERALTGARAQADALTARIGELDAQLAGAPEPQTLRNDLATIEAVGQ